MTDGNIEDNFKPETVNEVLLLSRIHDLRIQLLEKGIPQHNHLFGDSPFPKEVTLDHVMPTLVLAASVEAEYKDHKIKVLGKTKGRDRIGFSYYVTDMELYSRRDIAGLLSKLHERTLRQIADTLK
jgi:hypothetical protein